MEARLAFLEGFEGGVGASENSSDTGGEGGKAADGSLEKPRAGLHHLMDSGLTPALPFVSKQKLQQALEGMREDVRKWLEALQANMLTALERKADHDELTKATKQAMHAANVASESVAAFAKRTFVGKCASCDAPTQADLDKVPRPTNVGMQEHFPAHPSHGARNAIRPPDGLNRPPLGPGGAQSSKDRVPTMQEPRVSKDFPKGRILKASGSTGDLGGGGAIAGGIGASRRSTGSLLPEQK